MITRQKHRQQLSTNYFSTVAHDQQPEISSIDAQSLQLPSDHQPLAQHVPSQAISNEIQHSETISDAPGHQEQSEERFAPTNQLPLVSTSFQLENERQSLPSTTIPASSNLITINGGDIHEAQANATYTCPLCTNKSYSVRQHLSRHVRTAHANSRAELFNRNGESQFINCVRCNKLFLKNNGRVPRHICSTATVAFAMSANAASASVGMQPERTGEYYGQLIGKLSMPLTRIGHTWRKSFSSLTLKLIHLMTIRNERECLAALAAFLLLPGVISVTLQHKGSIKRLLAHFMEGDFIHNILLEAEELADKLEPRHTNEQVDEVNRLIKAANRLALSGRLSGAMKIVERLHGLLECESSSSEVDSYLNVNNHFLHLHPISNEQDQLNRPRGADSVNVSMESVLHMVRRLHRSSASGSSGWTNQAIQSVLLDAAEDKEEEEANCSIVTEFFNRCAQGDLPREACQLWCASRGILIPKSDGGFRPISIGESWYRFMGRTLSAHLVTKSCETLAPLQLACGLPAGCELGAHAAQLAWDLHDEYGTYGYLSLDIKNAFNTIRRSLVQKGIRTYLPQLERWFYSFYSQPSEIRLADGNVACMSETGVRQGDPLAMLCFCLGFQDTLVAIEQLLRQQGRTRIGIQAYADDILVYGDLHELNRLAPDIIAIVEDMGGLQVNKNKCKLVGLMVNEIIDPYIPIYTESVHMGNPIGSAEYRKDKAQTILGEATACLPALDKLHPQAAFLLLKFCINARPNYLARVCGLSIAGEALQHADTKILQALANILKVDLAEVGPEFERLSELPSRYGGLGIHRMGGLAGQKAEFLSRQTLTDFAAVNLRDLYPALEFWPPLEIAERVRPLKEAAASKQSTSRAATERMEENPGDALVTNAVDRRKLLQDQGEWRDATSAHVEHVFHEISTFLHKQLIDSGRLEHAAFYLSGCSRGSGRWTNCLTCSDPRLQFTKGEFLETLRMRLLLPTFDDEPNVTHICQCRMRVDINRTPMHLLNCECVHRLKTVRHSQLLTALIQSLRSVVDSSQVTVTREVVLEHDDGPLRADIRITSGPHVSYLDLAVVNPVAQKYMSKGAANHPDTAGRNKYEEKVKKYHQKFPRLNIIPFVVEAGGRITQESMTWMKKFYSDNTFKRSQILTLISVLVAKANAGIVSTARRFCQLNT